MFCLRRTAPLSAIIARSAGVSARASSRSQFRRNMATISNGLPHEQRTATEPRENRLEPVILANIREVNESVRLLRLNAVNAEHTIRVRDGS